MIKIKDLKPGMRIRSWDFEPQYGRADKFVDGILVDIKNGYLKITVEFDSVFGDSPQGPRPEVRTGSGMLFGEWNGRLQVLDQGYFVNVDTVGWVEEEAAIYGAVNSWPEASA